MNTKLETPARRLLSGVVLVVLIVAGLWTGTLPVRGAKIGCNPDRYHVPPSEGEERRVEWTEADGSVWRRYDIRIRYADTKVTCYFPNGTAIKVFKGGSLVKDCVENCVFTISNHDTQEITWMVVVGPNPQYQYVVHPHSPWEEGIPFQVSGPTTTTTTPSTPKPTTAPKTTTTTTPKKGATPRPDPAGPTTPTTTLPETTTDMTEETAGGEEAVAPRSKMRWLSPGESYACGSYPTQFLEVNICMDWEPRPIPTRD